MKKYGFISLLLFICLQYTTVQSQIIPKPLHTKYTDVVFLLTTESSIGYNNAVFDKVMEYLRKELLKGQGFANPVEKNFTKAALQFIFDDKLKQDAYSLSIDEKKVIIKAGTYSGAFNATSSLLQLIALQTQKNKTRPIQGQVISDAPENPWRGFMLDEARHFFGKAKVKSLLDWMAFYKLNKFHWHLTDEPAWRLEIKKYPLLSLVGGIGSFTNKTAPAQFYTQDDIDEIVAYASERNIEIIPEIDMPGHATAANRAYPQFSGGGTQKHPDFTFNPGKDATYSYLSNILKEVTVIFPSGILHLGGDEVAFGSESWKQDSSIQQLMRYKKLTDIKQVETYFMQRMADSVNKMNAQLLVWDEMADAKLSNENTIMMWWRHDKLEQLKKVLQNGYRVILCPRLPLYFDFVQKEDHQFGRKWGKDFNPLRNVYNFSSAHYDSLQIKKDQIIGMQANLWTETVTDSRRFDYLIFPRIAAFAEAAWTPVRNKDFEKFSVALKKHLPLYRAAGLYYFDPFENSNAEPVINKTNNKYIDNPE